MFFPTVDRRHISWLCRLEQAFDFIDLVWDVSIWSSSNWNKIQDLFFRFGICYTQEKKILKSQNYEKEVAKLMLKGEEEVLSSEG